MIHTLLPKLVLCCGDYPVSDKTYHIVFMDYDYEGTWNQAEVLRAESWVEGGWLKLTFTGMDRDFATWEVEVVVTIAFTMFHAQYPDIEVDTRLEVLGCYYEMVDIPDLHIYFMGTM